MQIGVDFLEQILPKRFPTIIGNVQSKAEDVNAPVVLRVHADLTEIEWAGVERVDARPAFAAVLGAEDAATLAADVGQAARAAFIALHHGVNNFGILAVDRQADPSGATRQPFLEFCPGAAAVGALENSAEILAIGVGLTEDKRPRRPPARIEYRVERIGVGGIERDLAAADAILVRRWSRQHCFP